MKKFILGLAVLPFLAGMSLAGQPQPLTDQQMDKVAAGFDFVETDINNVGALSVQIDEPSNPPSVSVTTGEPPVTTIVPVCGNGASSNCFINISGTHYPSGVQSFQLYAAFGPGFGSPP
ncbi:MAG TPA: hypothetical protein VLX09_08640 [Stellaceae bacterium]|nr:hypothetical protein [Stellaceae bacterium]